MTSNMPKASARQVFTKPINFLAFGFGSGLSPIMPGTCGTLVAIPIYLLMAPLPWIAYAIITLIMALIGIKLCDISAKDIGVHDYPGIVWDEIVGFLVTMFAVPVTWYWIVLGFVLFRLFDIWKPWPISWVNHHVHGGWGIMADDLLAAVFAWIVLHFITFLWVFERGF